MEAMEQDEGKQQQYLPVLPRLDRLDRLLQLLEEKHSLSSGRQLSCDDVNGREKGHEKEEEEEEEDDDDHQRKSLSSALDEVNHKGTLMDRVATLERRVLQLSMEMDDQGNTSRSSSSTVQVSKNGGDHHDLKNTSSYNKVSRHDDDQNIAIQHDAQKEHPLPIQEETVKEELTTQSMRDRSGKGEKRKGGYVIKWTRWLSCRFGS